VRKLNLNQRLLFVVLAALLPIAVFSMYQAIENRQYSQRLIADRLAVRALAAATEQREPLNAARLTLATLVQNPNVYENGPRCVEIFKESIRAQNSIINIIWSDASGIPLCSVLPIPPGTAFVNDEWWKRGVATKKFTLSAPFVSPISKRRVIVAMQPLFSSSGSYVGAVSVSINMGWIEEALRDEGASSNGLVGIADAGGNMVLSSGPRRFQKIDVRKSFGTAQTVKSYDSEEWMYSSAPLYENQLHVVYAEPARPLIVPMRDQLRAGIAWPVLAILLTLLAVWVGVNRMVVRWLKELGEIARQFANGDYSERRARFASAPPEISEVGADLHIMASAISERSAELEGSLKATRAMAREVNHRVKNNLQMIMSLLALQSGQVKHDEAKSVIDQTRARMAALSLIHRLLYEKSDFADQGEVDMDRVFHELCSQLHGSVGGRAGAAMECQSSVGNRPVDEAVPVALFAVEAISNAYRHAFPGGRSGHLSVSLSKSGDTIKLEIVDDGVGYDSGSNHNMMGMDLIRAFVEQLDGKLAIEANPDKGVSVTLTYSASRVMRMAD
jgi:two-component sensor histidine kinase